MKINKDDKVIKSLSYQMNNYKAKRTNIKYHEDYKLSDSDRVDVLLSQDNLIEADYIDIIKKSVGVCNGLLYRQTYSSTGIYMRGAGLATSKQLPCPSFGILDFSSIGEISVVPITKDMIIEFMPGTKLNHECYIKIPDKYAGKAALFSVGGFLYYEGLIVERISEVIYKLSISRMNLVDKLYMARKNGFDVSTLPLTTFEGCYDIMLAELETDEFITAYITHLQSFMIFTEYNSYTVEKEILKSLKFPGKYACLDIPVLPIISESGLVPNYRRQKATYGYVIHSDLRPINNKIYTTNEFKTASRLSYTSNAFKPVEYPEAHELIIRYVNK